MGQTSPPPSSISTTDQAQSTLWSCLFPHFIPGKFGPSPSPEAPEVLSTSLNPSVPLPAACLSTAPQVGSPSSTRTSSSPLIQGQEIPKAPKRPVPVLVLAEDPHSCWPSPAHTDLFPWEPCQTGASSCRIGVGGLRLPLGLVSWGHHHEPLCDD